MKNRKHDTWFLVAIAGVCLVGGILLGMVIQQMIFTAQVVEFGESLEGTTFNIEVDLNETQLIEEFKQEIVPILNESLKEEKVQEGIK